MRRRSSAAAAKKGQMIYIGPNLLGGRLSRFTVFKGGTPAYLEDLLPKIGLLVVPVAELGSALQKVKRAGTPEHEAYQSLMTSGKEV